MLLSECHAHFQESIQKLAEKYRKPVDDVYALWQVYSESCRTSDQSAILWEFEQWHLKNK